MAFYGLNCCDFTLVTFHWDASDGPASTPRAHCAASGVFRVSRVSRVFRVLRVLRVLRDNGVTECL